MDSPPSLVPPPPPASSSSTLPPSLVPPSAVVPSSSLQEPSSWSTVDSTCPSTHLHPVGIHHCSLCRQALEAGELEGELCCRHVSMVLIPKHDGFGPSHRVLHARTGYVCPSCPKKTSPTFLTVCELRDHSAVVHPPPSDDDNSERISTVLSVTAKEVSEVGVLAGGAGGEEAVSSSSSSSNVSSAVVAATSGNIPLFGSDEQGPRRSERKKIELERKELAAAAALAAAYSSITTTASSSSLIPSTPRSPRSSSTSNSAVASVSDQPPPTLQAPINPPPPVDFVLVGTGLSIPELQEALAVLSGWSEDSFRRVAVLGNGKIRLRSVLDAKRELEEEEEEARAEKLHMRMWEPYPEISIGASSSPRVGEGWDFDDLADDLREGGGGGREGGHSASGSMPSLSSFASSGPSGGGSNSSLNSVLRPTTPPPPPPPDEASPTKPLMPTSSSSSSNPTSLSRSFGQYPLLTPLPPSNLPQSSKGSTPTTRSSSTLKSDRPSSSDEGGNSVASTSKVTALALPRGKGDGKRAGKDAEEPKRRR